VETVSTCDYCQARVFFRPVSKTLVDGQERISWSPPLDSYAEETEVRTGGDGLLRLVSVTEFVQHDCEQGRAARSASAREREEYLAKQRELFARGETPEQLRERAMLRDCPRCGVKAGEECENLAERRKGNVIKNKNPHTERHEFRGNPG
jgi:hypothetical protein